ncbi:hypothetical protein MTO96_020948 [Rhipicephalus appendiculatus]
MLLPDALPVAPQGRRCVHPPHPRAHAVRSVPFDIAITAPCAPEDAVIGSFLPSCSILPFSASRRRCRSLGDDAFSFLAVSLLPLTRHRRGKEGATRAHWGCQPSRLGGDAGMDPPTD